MIPPIAAAAAARDPRCASPTNADQRACLLAQMQRDDVALNRDYQALIGALREVSGGREPRAVSALRDEQRAWLVERDRACRAATKAQAGLYWGAARVPCFAELSQRRAAALRARRVRLVGA